MDSAHNRLILLRVDLMQKRQKLRHLKVFFFCYFFAFSVVVVLTLPGLQETMMAGVNPFSRRRLCASISLPLDSITLYQRRPLHKHITVTIPPLTTIHDCCFFCPYKLRGVGRHYIYYKNIYNCHP